MSESLCISEIFRSIQGEGRRIGLPCTLVRLAGCNLDCRWCDTPYARDAADGEMTDLEAALDRVRALDCDRVELTGGEPLAQQPATVKLLHRLVDEDYEVLLETNGTFSLAGIDPAVVKVVDIKCPSSGAADCTDWDNIPRLRNHDEAKFVIGEREDFEYAAETVRTHALLKRCAVLFMPVFGRLELRDLAGWVLESGLDVRLGLQLHKIIWPEAERGV